MKKHYTITENDGVVRVDKFLAVLHPEYSRAALAKLFTLNLIKLNSEPIQPGYKLRPGTTFEYDLSPLQAKPEVIQLPILYEDDNVIVVDKPAGIISHARGKFWQEASVASFIRDRISGLSGDRGGIVHRLDRATSGVMICAKNEATLTFLQKQFSGRLVQKTYVAIVKGEPKLEKALIDAPIVRNLHTPKIFTVQEGGKSAQTEYSIIKKSNGYSMLELSPKTGRTHQLRVHLQYLHLPIVGDELYGGEKFSRLLLHAKKLVITIPEFGETTFNSPLPKEFDELL
jgi:23S rRNA pseudouridine1911/1915/1917 synthase